MLYRALGNLFLIAVLLPGFRAFAGEGDAGTLDLMKREALEFALQDDPQSHIPRVQSQLDKGLLLAGSLPWLRAIWYLSQARETLPEPELQAAATAALEGGHWLEWAGLRLSAIRQTEERGDLEGSAQLYETLLKDVRDNGHPLARALVLADFAEFLMEYNKTGEALAFVREANSLLTSSQEFSLLAYAAVKSAFAIALSYLSQNKAAIEVHLDLEDFYAARKIRNARATNLYNLALCHMNQEGGPPLETLRYLEESLRLARDIGSEEREAVSHYGLSMYYTSVKRFDEAVAAARQALRLYLKMKNQNWVHYTRIRLSEALVRAGRYRESLEIMALVWKGDKDLERERRMILSELRYEAYRGLGEREAALRQLESFVKDHKTASREREQAEYNRASVQLGLQFEEERNRAQADKLEAEQERNAALARQNQLQAEQISLLQKFRIASIVAVTLTLFVLLELRIVRRQAREIRSSRQKMQEVLDNIHEGIMIVDADLRISGGYSPYLETIWDRPGQSLAQHSLLGLLFPAAAGDDSRAIIVHDILRTCLGEGELSWELNQSHLPLELNLGAKILSLHWQALYDQQGRIASYLVSVRDVTRQRGMEREMQMEKAKTQRLEEKLEEVLSVDLSAARRLVATFANETAGLEDLLFGAGDLRAVFHRLHGWKGTARTLGLQQLAGAIHRLEACIDANLGRLHDVETALGCLHACLQETAEYVELLSHITERAESGRPMARNLYELAPVFAHDLERRLAADGLACEGLEVRDAVRHWRPDRMQALQDILMHALNNAIDHGFVRPAQRGADLRPARIVITASMEREDVRLTVRDNGAGIDWTRLQDRLRARNGEGERMPLDGEVLFQDGVSTATEATTTSGRGVGLSAIRAITEDLGGSVGISTAADGGVLLSLRFPRTAVCQRAEAVSVA